MSRLTGPNLDVFIPVWLVLARFEATNLGVFDLCHLDLLKRGCATKNDAPEKEPERVPNFQGEIIPCATKTLPPEECLLELFCDTVTGFLENPSLT